MMHQRDLAIRWLLPQIGDILAMAVFLGVIVLGPRIMNVDGDLGRHLVLGQSILDTHTIPTVDTFSHTMAGDPLTPHEWLAEVLFALSYRWMGLDGVVWLSALLLGGAFFLLFRHALAKSRSPLITLVMVLLGIAASSLHWLSRPHLFTLLLVVIWSISLDRMRISGGKGWWVLPPVMLVWVNLHGAFLIGFVLWVITGIGEGFDRLFRLDVASSKGAGFWKAWTAAGFLSFAMTVINPVGWDIWATTVGYIRNPYLVGHTAEYLSPNFHQTSTWPFLIMILASILVLGLKNYPIRATDLLLIACWTVMGLYSMRNIPIYALIATPVFAEAGAGLLNRLEIWKKIHLVDDRLYLMQQSLVGFIWPAAILVVGAVMLGAMTRPVNRFDEAVFPVAAAEWVDRTKPEGQMFNYFPWGGYLLYRLWPEYRVFIDGQTDFYGERLTREYERVITVSDGWKSTIERYEVDWVILPPLERLAGELKSEPAWQVAYQDETAIVFTRRR